MITSTLTVCSYGEINLNCGCPSQRVAKRCFGAQLMLNPELVQQIVLAMQRRVQCGITIKCRIGIDDLDSYEDLRTFINTSCLQTGVRKVVLHARKAVSGLNTKQNRAVPPLHHSIAHQLAKDYPDIQFVLNGGVQALDEAAQHLQPDWLYRYDPSNPFNDVHWSVLGKRALENADSDQFIALPAVHGVMLGRSAYNNPLLLANADSQFYGLRDPCLSRRMILERYMDYCDFVQSDAGPEKVIPASSHAHGHGHAEDKVSKVTCAILLNAMRNVINQVKHVNKFRQELNDVYVSEVRRLGGKDVANPSARLVIDQAMQVLDQDELDAPLGNMDFYPDAVE